MPESCLVLPFLTFRVSRYETISLKYKDEMKKECQSEETGFRAQLIQHCIDHLNGDLLIDYHISKGEFYVENGLQELMPKTNFLLKQYSLRLRNHY